MVPPQSPHDTHHQVFSPSEGRSVEDWLTLSFLPGMGPTLIWRLVDRFGAPGSILSAGPEQLYDVAGIGNKGVGVLTDPEQVKAARDRAAQESDRAAGHDYRLLCPDDPSYPEGLKNIPDRPVVLYCRGDMQCLARPAVAIVGSRAATSYGKRVSCELARELARQAICVVSGMAAGIDGEAHAGALEGGGMTVGVLGCGVDVVYPHQHGKLFEKVMNQGMLLTEYPPGTPPDAFRFPERNRIISGISLGTVVVEASLKSGSLITARMALDQGREVFAVPGRIDSTRSKGTHRLIQQGAKLVTCVDDILQELDAAGLLQCCGSSPPMKARPVELRDEEIHVLSFLDVYPVTIDELVRGTGYEAPAVFQALLQLELKGMIRQLPGQLYERRQEVPA